MRLTLHQLQVFGRIAALKSVTKAAHNLHMSQPAVSNLLKQLEDYYGCCLTTRTDKQLVLTQYGERVLRLSQEIETLLNETLSEISSLKGGLEGELLVATVSTAKYFVPRLLGAFKEKNPKVHVKISVSNRHQVIQRLRANMDDFVVMSHPPVSKQIQCIEFYKDELVVATCYESPLKNENNLILDTLSEHAWIMREQGSGTRLAVENHFKKIGFTPKIEMEISNTEAIKQAVMANMGITIISKQSIKLEVKNKLIRILPVKGFPLKHPWFLVKNKEKQLLPIADKFYQFACSQKRTTP